MSLPWTVMLSIVIILITLGCSVLFCMTGFSEPHRIEVIGTFGAWLVGVGAWILLQFHLYAIHPLYFQHGHGAPWIGINATCGVITLILVLIGWMAIIFDL